jgi:hypothetical protein
VVLVWGKISEAKCTVPLLSRALQLPDEATFHRRLIIAHPVSVLVLTWGVRGALKRLVLVDLLDFAPVEILDIDGIRAHVKDGCVRAQETSRDQQLVRFHSMLVCVAVRHAMAWALFISCRFTPIFDGDFS